ncbi:MAG: cyclic nucleotide-binding domain-containing protein [Treponema sp.]|jgi:TolA-binding protein|nr:cyclic nucleotide-binding domain-containing protein [Treponema sp.]
MSKMLFYRGGSVIYFQGDGADKICIVQKGSVRVTYQNIETGDDENETLQPGEFFGVKSALGRYNREENAVAVQDSVIMTMSVGEFEQFAMANTRIVMKMLKVFSNQLRRIHRQVTSLIVKEEQPSPEAGLFRVGEYYLKNKRYAHARYVFTSYLTYYPEGEKAAEATKGLETAEAMLSEETDVQISSLPSSGTGFIVGAGGSFALGTAGFSSLSGSQAPPGGKSTDFGTTGPGKDSAASVSKQTGTAKAYYGAVSLITQKKYQQAYAALQTIIKSGADQEYAAKSSFDMGRCLFLMGKYNDCIQHLGQVISNYPKHPELGTALFFMGQAYEKIGYRDQAAAFYKKILTVVAGEEAVYSKAKRALQDLGV